MEKYAKKMIKYYKLITKIVENKLKNTIRISRDVVNIPFNSNAIIMPDFIKVRSQKAKNK